MQLSREVTEAFPGLLAIALAVGGWFLALYIKRHAQDGTKAGKPVVGQFENGSCA